MNSLLPPNATNQERAIEAATARLAAVPVPVRELWNPDTCPAEFLPWLAWAFSVDRWEDDWTEAQKRAVIQNSIFIHRHKGTLGAVKSALQALGYRATVTEWFEDDAAPYTFAVDVAVAASGIDEALYSQLEKVIDDTKNVRSHLAALKLTGTVRGPLRAASSLTSGVETSVYPPSIAAVEQSGPLVVLAAEYTADFVTIHYQ